MRGSSCVAPCVCCEDAYSHRESAAVLTANSQRASPELWHDGPIRSGQSITANGCNSTLKDTVPEKNAGTYGCSSFTQCRRTAVAYVVLTFTRTTKPQRRMGMLGGRGLAALVCLGVVYAILTLNLSSYTDPRHHNSLAPARTRFLSTQPQQSTPTPIQSSSTSAPPPPFASPPLPDAAMLIAANQQRVLSESSSSHSNATSHSQKSTRAGIIVPSSPAGCCTPLSRFAPGSRAPFRIVSSVPRSTGGPPTSATTAGARGPQRRCSP